MSNDSFINGARVTYSPATGKVVMSPERQADLRATLSEWAGAVRAIETAIEAADESDFRGALIDMGHIARRAIGAASKDES
jgi:hypothetical protein